MEIRFKCATCGQTMTAADEMVETVVSCPNPACGCRLTVPSLPELSSEVPTSSDDIEFPCPHCLRQLTVDKSGAGMRVDCPECGKPIRIPNPSVSFRATSTVAPAGKANAPASPRKLNAVTSEASQKREPGLSFLCWAARVAWAVLVAVTAARLGAMAAPVFGVEADLSRSER